jgi:hypothetical protein
MAETGPSTIVCDAAGLGPDVATVDALAQLALLARRAGLRLRIEHCTPQLRAVIGLVGLADVLLGVEMGGQPEQREQRLGVEEERQLDDPAL